jgi:hypothetical protein
MLVAVDGRALLQTYSLEADEFGVERVRAAVSGLGPR